MKCPYCGFDEQRVLDSRPARDGGAIRRRRECESCSRRFTTFEEPERPRLMVIKRDGLRQEFDREKALTSMVIACRKRPVSLNDIREAVSRIERDLFDSFDSEVLSTEVGDRVMSSLGELDPVAFVRFASVYREFDCPQQFAEMVSQLKKDSRKAVASRA